MFKLDLSVITLLKGQIMPTTCEFKNRSLDLKFQTPVTLQIEHVPKNEVYIEKIKTTSNVILILGPIKKYKNIEDVPYCKFGKGCSMISFSRGNSHFLLNVLSDTIEVYSIDFRHYTIDTPVDWGTQQIGQKVACYVDRKYNLNEPKVIKPTEEEKEEFIRFIEETYESY
jgi:hypothetical protein